MTASTNSCTSIFWYVTVISKSSRATLLVSAVGDVVGVEVDGLDVVGSGVDANILVTVGFDVVVGLDVVGLAVDGAEVVGLAVVGLAVVGLAVLGFDVVGSKVDGSTVVGERVVGLSVVGTNVTGTCVVGLSVAGATVAGSGVVGEVVLGIRVKKVGVAVGDIVVAVKVPLARPLKYSKIFRSNMSYELQLSWRIGCIFVQSTVEEKPSGQGVQPCSQSIPLMDKASWQSLVQYPMPPQYSSASCSQTKALTVSSTYPFLSSGRVYKNE